MASGLVPTSEAAAAAVQRQDSAEEDRHVRWDLSSCLAKPDHLHHSDSQTSGIFSQVEKNISCVKKKSKIF